MWKDKSPKKWTLLAVLFLIALFGIALYFSMRAQAAGDRFLPIKELVTPGGISVWMVEDNSLPIIALEFAFADSGTANDPQDKQGLVRLLSNTMDEGAGDLDSQSFQKQLSDHSITLLFNAGRDSFGGSLKTLARHKDKAFDLLSLAVTSPRFDNEAVERMRAGNLTRLKSSLSEPDWMAARLINDKAFEGHPYAKNSGGTISGLSAITPDDLRAFKEASLTKDRLIVAVAGDISEADVKAAIDKIFGKLPAKGPAKSIPDMTLQNAGKTFSYAADVPQTMVEIMMPSLDVLDPDYHALQVMNYIFGGAGFGSRLMEEAREKNGLTYGIYSSLQDYRHADVLAVSTSTKNESAKQMLGIISDEMTKMQTSGATDQELADAKSYITGSMPLSVTTTQDIAAMLLSLQMKGLPATYLDQFADKINAISSADIARVAKRILKPSSMTTSLVGMPKDVASDPVKELPNVR